MAGRYFTLSGTVTVSTSRKTLAQLIAATNHAAQIIGFEGSAAGDDPTAVPGKLELVPQTTAGTASAATLVAKDSGVSDTLDSSGQINATVEPTTTASATKWETRLHPQIPYGVMWPREAWVTVPAGTRMGLLATYAVGTDITFTLHCME